MMDAETNEISSISINFKKALNEISSISIIAWTIFKKALVFNIAGATIGRVLQRSAPKGVRPKGAPRGYYIRERAQRLLLGHEAPITLGLWAQL